MMVKKKYTFVDLFAGLGGFHLAFNQLGRDKKFKTQCVFVSELKEDLRHLYSKNYNILYEKINSDITQLKTDEDILSLVPEHDILFAGFPCQPFSKAGKQQGFNDEEGRGVLFDYIVNIIKIRRPKYIFLENVSNLKTHDEGNTWKVIFDKLSKPICDGGLNYDIKEEVLSPHEFGFPQYRKRIYIVGIDKEKGNLDNFEFPKGENKKDCNICNIIDKNPEEIVPIKPVYKYYLEIWQHFLNECQTRKAELPHAPIWAMEFGADYPYTDKAPCFLNPEQLCGKKGSLGKEIKGSCIEECLQYLPNYARSNKVDVFPKWKQKFIKENRDFYERNKEWLDVWKEKLDGWDNSFIKFEWNCSESEEMNIEHKIVQFRPSGIRVKEPTYSPALTFMGNQIPIFPWIEYKKSDGTIEKGRYMTVKEATSLQGMEELSFEGLTKSRIYEALGNAVNVEVVKLIIEKIITTRK